MTARPRRLLSRLWPLLIVSVLTLAYVWLEFGTRYISWRTLSKEELVTEATVYVRTRTSGKDACIYYTTCRDGRAGLKLVTSLDQFDLEATKQLAWDRKFKNACPGRTAHFALELLPDPLAAQQTSGFSGKAVWSFYNDRFIPILGRFHGPYAFSETPYKNCTAEFVISRLSSRSE